MGELTIRRNRGFAPVQYQPAGKGEKTSGSSRSQSVRGTAGFTVSETLRQLMSRVSQAEAHTRESRRTLQLGEGVLAEVQDSLARMEELARQAGCGARSTGCSAAPPRGTPPSSWTVTWVRRAAWRRCCTP